MKRLLFVLLFLIPRPSYATFTFVIATSAGSGDGGNNVTTTGIDTSSAGATNLVIAEVSDYFATGTGASPCSLSDSKSNTYTPLTTHNSTNNDRQRLLYSINATVGTGHTWSCSLVSGSPFPSVAVAVFSATGTITFSAQSGAANDSGTTVAPGSIANGTAGRLFVTGLANESATVSIDSSFTIPTGGSVAYSAGNFFASAIAYKMSGTAENPTWTVTGGEKATGMAMFDSVTPAVGPKKGTLLTLGVGR